MSLLRAYERIERHQAAKTQSSEGPASLPDPTPQATTDLLTDPLSIPICDLIAPLPLESSVLDETVFFVANAHQAATVRANGGIPYTPEEVDVLWALYQVTNPEAWREHLRLIHEAKRRFSGTIIPEESR